jgi:hypothetical protein
LNGPLEDIAVPLKVKLAGLWTSVMFCYIYADYFGLYQPGSLKSMLEGKMEPLGQTTQLMLVGTSLMMAIPSVMIFLSLALKANVNRWLNIVCGVLYTIIIVLTAYGSWAFFILFGVIEVALTLLVVWYVWKWPRGVAAASVR